MNKKRTIVMLTILLVTVLSASSFYMIEKGINPLSIFVNSYAAEPSSNDFEKVYGDKNAPYTETSGEHKGEQYFIRYTGKQTKSTIVNLTEIAEEGGKVATNSSVTSFEDGYPMILGTKITSTYKMFTKSSGLETYVDVEKVFIPDSIAIQAEENDSITDKNKGIQSNTFLGCNTQKEIDLIYHTGTVIADKRASGIKDNKFDKTRIIKQNNVITYVYLGNENILRPVNGFINDTDSYIGSPRNCYISHEVEVPACLFYAIESVYDEGYDDVTKIRYALIECQENQTKWSSLRGMFAGQDEFELQENFKIPDNITNIRFMFQSCKKIKNLNTNFEIPSTVVDLTGLFFIDENLESLNEKFTIPKSATTLERMFTGCTNLKKIPTEFDFSQNENIINMDYTFVNCQNLKGVITIPESVTTMIDCFSNAGVAANLDNLENYNTPIVMKCYEGSAAASYVKNIYGEDPDNPGDSKVTKEVINGEWAKVYESGAPYGTISRQYYIRYVGKNSVVNLTETTETDQQTTVKSFDNGYPVILETTITSTYKMFAENANVSKIYLPSSIAIDENGIESNTFVGCEQNIKFIYHAQLDESDIDERGTNIEKKYDKTDKIPASQTNVITYLYLGDDNINRENVPEVANYYSYLGKVANVYVSSYVKNIQHLFYTIPKYDPQKLVTQINYVDLDKNGTWENMDATFGGQESLKLSEDFQLPKTVKNLSYLFQDCYGLEELPNTFEIYDTVTAIDYMFYKCTNLKSLPENFAIPNKELTLKHMFEECNHLRGIITIPEKAIVGEDCFSNAGNIPGLANLVNYNTPIVMKCDEGSTAASITKNIYGEDPDSPNDGKVTKVINSTSTNSAKLSKKNVNIDSVQDISSKENSKIDSNETLDITIDSQTNQDISGDKVVIEDETDWVTITVNKKSVDEVVEETQTNSQSEESVEGENKESEEASQE